MLKTNKLTLLVSIVLCFQACNSNISKNTLDIDEADNIINLALKAHGGKLYDNAHYQFKFRNGIYTFINNGPKYIYTSTKIKDGRSIVDKMTNAEFTRSIDGEPITLSEKELNGYSNSLNSVIYFATLPHKLKDPAVNKSYLGTTQINDKSYHIVEVTFDKEGGGKDHDDQYYYWINVETNIIDFLAYNYRVGKGGVRFRAAQNSRIISGIVFQDYINYKAPVGTLLSELPSLYEKKELVELSKILTEEVTKI